MKCWPDPPSRRDHHFLLLRRISMRERRLSSFIIRAPISLFSSLKRLTLFCNSRKTWVCEKSTFPNWLFGDTSFPPEEELGDICSWVLRAISIWEGLSSLTVHCPFFSIFMLTGKTCPIFKDLKKAICKDLFRTLPNADIKIDLPSNFLTSTVSLPSELWIIFRIWILTPEFKTAWVRAITCPLNAMVVSCLFSSDTAPPRVKIMINKMKIFEMYFFKISYHFSRELN